MGLVMLCCQAATLKEGVADGKQLLDAALSQRARCSATRTPASCQVCALGPRFRPSYILLCISGVWAYRNS